MKDRATILMFSAILLVGGSGCRKGSTGKEEASAPAPAATKGKEEASAPAAKKRADKPPPLEVQLASEARNRSTGALSADQILSALARANVKVADPRQEIATVHRANFCVGGSTDNGLALSVCEYDSDEAARAGREHSLKMFAAIPNREIFVHGRTALVLRADRVAPGEHPDARRAVEAFRRLSPTQ